MIATFGILALFLVAANAGIIEQPINYEKLINDIMQEGKQAAIETVHQLEHRYEEIIGDPLHQVDEALNAIEVRKEEDEACVDAQGPYIEAVLSDMHDEMNHCGVVAARTSTQIALDVTRATQQLIFDGYDCYKTYHKCQSYKNPTLSDICWAKFSIKITLYMVNARHSIKTIKKAPERETLVFTDTNVCVHQASDKAISELEIVNKNIDACLLKH